MSVSINDFVQGATEAGLTLRHLPDVEHRGKFLLPSAWRVPIYGWIMVWLPDEGGCITLIRNNHKDLAEPSVYGVGRFDSFELALASLDLMSEG